MTFGEAFAKLPLIAILRGVRPQEAVAIGEALVGAGFRLIEVPMNSPDPLDSIRRLATALGDRAIIGAGTVLSPDVVQEVRVAGGTLIVSPNTNPSVIRATIACGMASAPGAATPSEAFDALAAGATVVKMFPAEAASPAVLKAWLAVLPTATRVVPVGSITPTSMEPWRQGGAAGFGLGSAIYRPGDAATSVAAKAKGFVEAWHAWTDDRQ